MLIAQNFARASKGELGFGLFLQTAARHDPSHAVGDRRQQNVGGDDRQHRFAAAGRNRADNRAHVGDLPGGNLKAKLAKSILMRAKRHGERIKDEGERIKGDSIAK